MVSRLGFDALSALVLALTALLGTLLRPGAPCHILLLGRALAPLPQAVRCF
jgi:hypothetical protein